MKVILETSRLILRQFTETDASFVWQLNTAPGVLQFIPESIPGSFEDAEIMLTEIILPQYKNSLGRWAVYLKENNKFIGWCGFKRMIENNEIDLGYRFIPPAWGNGYATEAAKATLEYGLNTLKLKKIIAHAHADNIASQKILEKIGMQFIGEGIDRGLPVKGYVSFGNNL